VRNPFLPPGARSDSDRASPIVEISAAVAAVVREEALHDRWARPRGVLARYGSSRICSLRFAKKLSITRRVVTSALSRLFLCGG